MDTVAKADIFFFITSIVVVLGGLLFLIILGYLILIFRDLRAISTQVKRETELIAMDIDQAREKIKSEVQGMSSFIGFLKGIFMNKARSTKKK